VTGDEAVEIATADHTVWTNHPASKVGIQLVFLTYGQIKRRDESVIVWLKVLDVPNLSTRCGDQLGE
jgi:hypothetical protein